MKKFLVVLLALAMVFAIATTAMAADKVIPDYNDTKTSTEYAVDIYRLTALGVLEGNTGWGGAYRPADNLTRAEFAKIACFMFGKQDYKNFYAAQKSAFSDVPEGHWAEGWINCANDNGLMIGVGGGKFAPEAKVSKQEVATVTLRGVGYDDNLPGEWPADYIAKSQEVHTWFEDGFKDGESLFEYVQKIDGTAATRAEMAAIVNYCLDLYRVDYVGSSKTIVYGIGEVDNDGYAYKINDTNEQYMGEYTSLLWDVFNAYVIPVWRFENPDDGYGDLMESGGWGYEDFEEDELLFAPSYGGYYRPSNVPSVLTNASMKAIIIEDDIDDFPDNEYFYSYGLPVASNYYIFDQYLDGELWQLGNRYAFLTVQYNNKDKQSEALFAEMITDVNYTEEEAETDLTFGGKAVKAANADIYTGTCFDDDDYDIYDYDDFADEYFAIVKDVKKGDIAVVDQYGYGEQLNGKDYGFCLLDDCEEHDKNYVFLKDGKFSKDASCLAVNDVVYKAGDLVFGDYVELYIAISPKAAKLEELTFTPDSDLYEECYGTTRQVTIDGKDYWFCEDASTSTKSARGGWHLESLDGGYKDGSYKPMAYDDLYDKLTDKDQDVLFAPGYGKLYAATIIFAAESENKQYGVLIDEDYAHVGNYYIDGVEFFGPDGKNTGLLDLDENVKNGSGQKEDLPPYLEMLGTLTNYFLDDEAVITKAEDVADDPYNWLKNDAGKNDIGYIAIAPAKDPIAIETKDGKFTETSAKAIDKAFEAIADKYVGEKANYAGAEGKKITEDTIIFEITAKANDDGDLRYKSVKLGDFADYKNADFTADEFVIFAAKDKDVKVLYVVNPSFAEPETIGLFDVSKANDGGGYAKFLPDGTIVKFADNNYKELENTQYVYGAYKLEGGECDNVVAEGSYEPAEDVEAGDFVVLITKAGWGVNASDAKAIIKNLLPADYVSDILTYDELAGKNGLLDKWEITGTTEFIDLAKKGASYSIGDTDKIVHSKDAENYEYILIGEDPYNVLQIVRVDKGASASNTDTFIVSFDTGDAKLTDTEAKAFEDQEVDAEDKAKKPSASTFEGYTLDGYYEDADFLSEFDFDTEITEDTTVYVKLTPNTYTVTFVVDGGTAPDAQTVEYKDTAEEPEAPEIEGKEFVAWVDADEEEFDFSTEITEDTTLTAVYEDIVYIVTFDSNGGSDPDPATIEVKYGASIEESAAPTVTRDGKEFVAWTAGGSAVTFPYSPTENVTLKASWKVAATGE